MDDGNQDQNFSSRRQQFSSSPEYHPPPPAFDSRSPPRPAKVPQEPIPSLTVENLAAATSNGYLRDGLNIPGDPATFYRSIQSSASGFPQQESYNMAATTSDPRLAHSSLRSNGNGSTPKHPPLPHARAGLKPSLRSASSPLDNRAALNGAKSTSALNGYGNARQPSVKDLLKRFDQNNEQSSSTPPKPAPRISTRDGTRSNIVKERVGHATRSASNLNTPPVSRPTTTTTTVTGRLKSPPPRTTQRARFAAEDQHSNNTLSSATRASRSRNSVSGNNAQASKSMTNLSPTSTNPLSPTRRPLFGEVLPLDQDNPDIGYGIPARAAHRRTSESSLRPSFGHQRRRSDDISPSSPTAWYLGVTPALDDVNPDKGSRRSGHNRSHSDLLDAKVNTMNGVNPSFQTSNSPTSSAARRSSRLPVARNTSISSSESSTTASTRANSPYHSKTLSNGKVRKSDQRPWSPAGRSTTPTSRAKTPTHTSPRKARTPEKSTSNNASLKAYISAPLPKTSPPLRSSRPRAPISTATSKSKPGDLPNPPQQIRTGMKLTRNNVEAKDARERRIPDVPLSSVDFVARREKIQRAYTKSIHENEQKEIRAANLRRLTARQNAEKAAAAAAEKKEEIIALIEPTPSLELPPPAKAAPQPLQIDTSFQKPKHIVVRGYDPAMGDDSPTLGIPGAFVDDDEPPSAISNVTGTTEIENEPQTEAARMSRIPSQPSGLSSNAAYFDEGLSPEQAIFGVRNMDQESIQIMLDATPVEQPQYDSTPTKDDFGTDHSLPGAFQSDDRYFEPPIFTSTLTTASPLQDVPSHAIPSTPPDSKEDQEMQDQRTQLHSQPAPEIYFTDEIEFTDTPDSGEAPRLQLPLLRTALAPPSHSANDGSDVQTPLTDMEYESSEVGNVTNDEHDPYGPEYAVREGLVSPTTLRFSTRSSWRTDYSVGTGDEYSERENGLPDNEYENSRPASEPERKPIPPPKELVIPPVPPKPEGYSPLPSPRFPTNDMPRIPSPQLPEVATGEGFSFSFSDDSPGFGTVTIPQLSPSREPPPIPNESSENVSIRRPPSFYNRRTPSSYHSSQNGTGRTADSRRASDEVYSPRGSISTPRSSTHVSLEDPEMSAKQKSTVETPVTEEEKKAAEKLKKRLFQRGMVIKELIDTESVYLKDMNVVEEIYKGTAEACPKLEPGDVKVIFRNTDKIVEFSTKFLDELKAAAAPIYTPRHRSKANKPPAPSGEDKSSGNGALSDENEETKDKKTSIGSCFNAHLKEMEDIYTDFLKNSEAASSRLVALQHDGAVKVWLSECNLVAKDLTAAWDLDALLVKPVQRITRYQLLLTQICSSTPEDHPDHEHLKLASSELLKLLTNIDDLKKRIHMVGKIVGRKRKESDVRVGSNFVKALRRNDKIGINPDRSKDDADYLNSHERFSDDYLRLQVVLRDVQFYTRTAATWVQDFLRYLSSMELIMRMAASQFPEIESKWARYNMSMRDMGTHILEKHVESIEKRVIAPIEQVIAAYGPPGLAMKKRDKRRLDYEKATALKQQGKKIEAALADRVAQYEALNETLKMELPKLSNQTKAIGNICLAQLVCIQVDWWSVWQAKVRSVLEENQFPKDIADLVDMFFRDFRYSEARVTELGIVNGVFGNEKFGPMRGSQSTSRSRGLSVTSEKSPTVPAPDFQKRLSANLNFSPIFPTTPNLPHMPYNPATASSSHSRVNSNSPATPDPTGARPLMGRPNTGRSFTSDSGMRAVNDYNNQYRRESGSTYGSASHHVDGPPQSARPISGVFHSAMPMGEGWEDSNRSSRASSRDRNATGGYSVLYLAASLFEFNISATKQEAGYPYLTYQAGEIFDVIGEKGELWLAKNQDDPDDTVGWIWSKHFARLAAN